MYHKKVMDYYRNEAHKGGLDNANLKTKKLNPSCGDEIAFTGIIKDGNITDLKYEGSGCIISQAGAALLCELAVNQPIDAILSTTPEDLLSKFELTLGPNRMQCIELPLETLQNALKTYQKNHA